MPRPPALPASGLRTAPPAMPRRRCRHGPVACAQALPATRRRARPADSASGSIAVARVARGRVLRPRLLAPFFLFPLPPADDAESAPAHRLPSRPRRPSPAAREHAQSHHHDTHILAEFTVPLSLFPAGDYSASRSASCVLAHVHLGPCPAPIVQSPICRSLHAAARPAAVERRGRSLIGGPVPPPTGDQPLSHTPRLRLRAGPGFSPSAVRRDGVFRNPVSLPGKRLRHPIVRRARRAPLSEFAGPTLVQRRSCIRRLSTLLLGQSPVGRPVSSELRTLNHTIVRIITV